MTKKRMNQLAKRARAYGYHRAGEFSDPYVFCPLCRTRVDGHMRNAWDKSIGRALDAGMLEHLEYDCKAAKDEAHE